MLTVSGRVLSVARGCEFDKTRTAQRKVSPATPRARLTPTCPVRDSGCSEIVRQAAKDFPHEWQRGEITYFARKERAAKSSRADETPGAKPLAAGPRFPLKILDVN